MSSLETKFNCPECHESYQLAVDPQLLLGKKFKCRHCQHVFTYQEKTEDTKSELSSPETSPPHVEEKRKHHRVAFQQRAIFLSEKKYQYFGSVKNMGVSSASFQLCTHIHKNEVTVGERGIIQIALTDLLPLEDFSITFPCYATRVTPQEMGLCFTEFPDKDVLIGKVARRSKVYVRRSNGTLEGGWELSSSFKDVPDSIKQSVHNIHNAGPVAICFLKQPNGKPLYKAMFLKDVINIHNSNVDRLIQDIRKIEDVTVMEEWRSPKK